MITKLKNYKVVAPKDFIKEIKEVYNLSFDDMKKGTEYWCVCGMYEVIYCKHNTIRFKKMLSY